MDAILADKPESAKSDDYLDRLYDRIFEETQQGWTEPDTYRVLQITDWHIDLYYTEGTIKKDCNALICCGLSNGMAENPEEGAGRYGELTHCDLPIETAEK